MWSILLKVAHVIDDAMGQASDAQQEHAPTLSYMQYKRRCPCARQHAAAGAPAAQPHCLCVTACVASMQQAPQAFMLHVS